MSPESLLQKRNTQLSWRVGSHVLFWLSFYLAFAYYHQIALTPFEDSPYGYLDPIHNTLGLALVFYALVYWVFPKLILKKRWLLSIISFMLLCVVYAVITYLGETLIMNYCDACREVIGKDNGYYLEYLDKGFVKVMVSRLFSLGILLQLLVYLMIPLAVKGGLSYHQSYVRNLQLAQDNVQLELSFLKAQLNPHFLFNTLNNLYGLIIQERTDKSAQTVSRLSDFMRYTLHDSGEKLVPFEKEMELIKNYIELEQLRLNKTKISFEFDTDGTVENLPPLLFLPLLENAFKYVDDYGSNNFIMIRINAFHNKLDFLVRNSFDMEQKVAEVGGVGHSNLKKRLALHFPNNHSFKCGVLDLSYYALLNLKFQ
ncbi:MAG: histidine kinase [Roseivirga sp.]|nr:histidine kinase [Roseivirga sp.]